MKRCSMCSRRKELTEFHKNHATKDGLAGRCKKCAIKTTTAWRLKNPERALARRQKLAKQKRELVDRAKNVPCNDCGGIFPSECMDLDHVRGNKVKDVGTMVYNMCSVEVIQREINKCEVVCANCHRSRTRKRRIL